MKLLMSHHLPLDRFTTYLEGVEVIRPVEPLTAFSREEMLEKIVDVDMFFVSADFPLDAELMERGKNLKIVGTHSAGYNNVDVAYATSRGLPVMNTPKGVQDATAELAIALMLSAARSVTWYDRRLRQTKRCQGNLLLYRDMPLRNKTLGIVGFGGIGQMTAVKAQAFGMKIVYNNRTRLSEEVEGKYNATYLPLEELLKTADIVSVHAPYHPENHHLINAERLAMMKPTAYLVNTSRGPLVDEAALIEALKNHTIAGAGIDVYEFEPVVSDGLVELENVVLTSHCGTNMAEVRLDMLEELMAGQVAIRNGQRPYNQLNEV